MRILIAMLGLAVLAACSTGEDLTACKGPVFPLNPDHWTPGPGDLAKPEDAK